jgi:hypothetical protein
MPPQTKASRSHALTLIGVVKSVLYIDLLYAILLVVFTIYPVYVLCRSYFVKDMLNLFHFVQTISISGVIDDWHLERKTSHYIQDPAPTFWIRSTLLALTGDTLLFISGILDIVNIGTDVASCTSASGVDSDPLYYEKVNLGLQLALDVIAMISCFVSIILYFTYGRTYRVAKTVHV